MNSAVMTVENSYKMRLVMKRSLLFGVGIAALLLVGCKPKSGAACKGESREVCIDQRQALACHNGIWEDMICRGPRGCLDTDKSDTCDQSIAEDRDTCNLEHDFVCSADKKRMLECRQGHWATVQSCLGDRGCSLDDKRVTCDNSIANADDVCRDEKDYACTADRTTALVCQGGKFVVVSRCKGKDGCRLTGNKASGFQIDCDDSVANAGDACERENNFACGSDQVTILKCVGKKFSAVEKCLPTQRCDVRGDTVGCY